MARGNLKTPTSPKKEIKKPETQTRKAKVTQALEKRLREKRANTKVITLEELRTQRKQRAQSRR